MQYSLLIVAGPDASIPASLVREVAQIMTRICRTPSLDAPAGVPSRIAIAPQPAAPSQPPPHGRPSRPEFEVVCVAPEVGSYDCDRFQSLGSSIRAVSVSREAGLSAALAAGIAAARGDVLIAVEASRQYRHEQIEWLLKRLVRADLVIGRRTRGPLAKLALGLMQLPRRVLLGLEVRDPDCLFWAARREAVAGLPLAAGMHRFLGSLVATRGYRVTEIYVDHTPREQMPHGRDGRASLRNLVSVWRERRKEEAARRNQPAVMTPAPKLAPAATREAPANLTSRSAA